MQDIVAQVQLTPEGAGRFRRLFRRQVAVVFATIVGLTGVHFVLAVGGLTWIVTNGLFLAGLGVSGWILTRSARLVENETSGALTRLESSYLGIVQTLSAALEAKDVYTRDHTLDVHELVLSVGRAMRMTDTDVAALSYGALFHDVGKIGIPESILNKPGRLTAEEWKVMKRHTVIGEQILAPLHFLAPVLPIVRHEHERWDGKGYPDGLAGDAIPVGSRIILVCDAYHAMTSDRPYRESLGCREAIRRLREGSGTQFDPRVVEAFLDAVADCHEGAVPEHQAGEEECSSSYLGSYGAGDHGVSVGALT